MARIFIIGFPGSGKTALAVELANLLGWNAVDLDQRIEEKTGHRIHHIFEEYGESHFRKWEQQILESVLDTEGIVVSTGGGTPCFFDNMDRMKNAGICVYLKASEKELFQWLLEEPGSRPLIKGKTNAELEKWISETLIIREPFYNKAQIIVTTEDFNAEAIRLRLPKSLA